MGVRCLVLISLISLVSVGCVSEGRVRYFCPDGREVSDSELCFVGEGMCDSVEGIMENRNRCNLKKVGAEGVVSGIAFRTSGSGNDYTTFSIESNGTILMVFAWEHLKISENESVRVDGVFHKEKRVGRYSFKNEIEAEGVEVK